jgi:hypothetical protein
MGDTFLDHGSFKSLCANVSAALDGVKALPPGKKNAKLANLFPFKGTFDTKGYNGLAGRVEFKRFPLVYKIGLNPNYTIQNEGEILEKLNSIRGYCPNFLGCVGSAEVLVSQTYIQTERHDIETDQEEARDEFLQEKGVERFSLWDADDEYSYTRVLFLEYVSNMTLYQVTKYSSQQKILAQYLQVLSALQIAQDEVGFTHYDMHADNVLVRECDPNAVFVYLFDDERYCVTPTHGLHSVIIDMGNGHVQKSGQETAAIFGHSHGHTPVRFDPTVDIHHLLVPSTYDIYIKRTEDIPRFRQVLNKVMMTFKHCPVYVGSGWRKFPTHTLKEIVTWVTANVEACNNGSFWEESGGEICDLLVALTKRGWKTPGNFQTSQSTVVESFTVVSEWCDCLWLDWDMDDNHLLLALKAMVDAVFAFGESKRPSKDELVKMLKEVDSTLNKQGVHLPKTPKNALLISALMNLAPLYASMLAVFDAPNIAAAADCNKKAEVKSPYEMLKLLERWTGGERMKLNAHSVFYVFDVKGKRTVKIPAAKIALPTSGKPLKRKEELVNTIRKFLFSQN